MGKYSNKYNKIKKKMSEIDLQKFEKSEKINVYIAFHELKEKEQPALSIFAIILLYIYT